MTVTVICIDSKGGPWQLLLTQCQQVTNTARLLTFHSSLQAVLFGSHQDEEPFCRESAGKPALEDQQAVALPTETYSFVKKCIIIYM